MILVARTKKNKSYVFAIQLPFKNYVYPAAVSTALKNICEHYPQYTTSMDHYLTHKEQVDNECDYEK